MSILASELICYGSANMQDTDSGTQGGAIDTSKRVVFNDISPSGNVQIVSSSASDTAPTVTTYGRDAGGVLISEVKTLNGTTVVPMTVATTWERLLKAVKSGTCVGDVCVESVTTVRSNTAQAGAAQSVTLDASASGSDDAYKDMIIRLTGGTGAGQIRRITKTDQAVAYNGTTKVAYVDRAWGTNPDGTTTFKISNGFYFEKSPAEVLEVRRPFYNAAADAPGGSSRDYYEKVFMKNTHGTLTLTSATIAEQADPSGKVTFALATSLDDTGTSTDRRTVPASGVGSFDSTTKNVANSQNHTAGSRQGIWLKLTLAAGDAAQKTSYTIRESGAST